jgi:DNA recombination protein RmuC
MKVNREEQYMNEGGTVLALLAGVVVGITGGLLLLAGKNRLVQELLTKIRGLEEGGAELREKLAVERERRAGAEERGSRVQGLEENLDKKQQENSVLQARLSELETRLEDERQSSAEKLALLEEARDQMKIEFQNVANKIFEDKSRKFTEQNRENIEGVLKPVREQLGPDFAAERNHAPEKPQRADQRGRGQPDQCPQGAEQDAGNLGRDDPGEGPGGVRFA